MYAVTTCCTIVLLLSLCTGRALANDFIAFDEYQDTTAPATGNSNLRFPINDRRGDAVSGKASKNTYDFKSPSNITDSVVYDAINRRYTVYEKIGNRYYRIPTSYSFEEYWQMRNEEAEKEYFRQRANTTSLLNRNKFIKPRLSLTDGLFNRLFGNGKIEITPQGNLDLSAGYQGQKIDNP
ncbi:MAG: hypothetical protein WD135_05365, partial [Ferruginibacter sp.]